MSGRPWIASGLLRESSRSFRDRRVLARERRTETGRTKVRIRLPAAFASLCPPESWISARVRSPAVREGNSRIEIVYRTRTRYLPDREGGEGGGPRPLRRHQHAS